MTKVNWWDREVHCKFYDGGKESIPLEEFEGMWTDKFGGFYFPEGA